MSAWQAALLALALAFAGMSALAFALQRHHEQLTRLRGEAVPVARRRRLRCLGVLLLVIAVIPCVLAWGGTVGAVAWLGWLSAGALASAAGIAVQPQWTARAAALLAALALLALACW